MQLRNDIEKFTDNWMLSALECLTILQVFSSPIIIKIEINTSMYLSQLHNL
jgi:hypothetical protein